MGIKWLRAGAAVAFLLLASVAVASAGSSADKRSSQSGDRDSVVLRLQGKVAGEIVYVDLGKADYSPADQYVYSSDLSREGKKVGVDGAVCTVVRVEDNGASTLRCYGINSLPGGQITTAGLITYGPDEEFKKEPYFFAVTGGTGKYRNARGEVKIKDLGSSEAFRRTFRIVL
jgi:hypothetical protein